MGRSGDLKQGKFGLSCKANKYSDAGAGELAVLTTHEKQPCFSTSMRKHEGKWVLVAWPTATGEIFTKPTFACSISLTNLKKAIPEVHHIHYLYRITFIYFFNLHLVHKVCGSL